MIIFPVLAKSLRRKPPVITLMLIALNGAIYWGVTQRDATIIQSAVTYYQETHLDQIEVPLFEQYMARHPVPGSQTSGTPGQLLLVAPADLIIKIYGHQEFITALPELASAALDSVQYRNWLRHHLWMQQSLARISWFDHGLHPAHAQPQDLITYFFLHQDLGHLLGNLLFLLLVGYVLEMHLGKATYFVSYLVIGIATGGILAASSNISEVIVIGASGAISGLTGMFVMLFGKRKFRYFYHALFYRGYFQLKAYMVVPAWFGYEGMRMAFFPSNDANLLSLCGGFAMGLLLGAATRMQFTALSAPAPTAADTGEQAPSDNLSVTEKLAVFRTYMENHGKLPETAIPHLFFLVTQFIQTNHIEEAESLTQLLLVAAHHDRRLPEVIYQLALKYRQLADTGNFMRCRDLLIAQFPDSPSTRQITANS